MAVYTEETKLGQIEILDTGRVQFREEIQVYKDGKPFGSPEFHRSGVDVGYLDEFDNLVLLPLPEPPFTRGNLKDQTNMDLDKLLEAVRTPEVQAAWKQKLIDEREEQLKREDAEKEALAEQERIQAEAQAAEQHRIQLAVQEVMRKQKTN